MSHETSKATKRRLLEDKETKYPFWQRVFTGNGLDVGSGNDPLPFLHCKPFDKKDGDANALSKYFKPASFDYIHASQLLEHLHNPEESLKDWHGLVKPGG